MKSCAFPELGGITVTIPDLLYKEAVAQEPSIFGALRQQLLWPSIHAAVDVYQRRRASNADNYELIWRLIHICECVVITIASAAISRIRDLGRDQDFLKLRERCYGVTWNATEASLEKGQGALDGSIDKWIEIIQYIATCPPESVESSRFLVACQSFLMGSKTEAEQQDYYIDLAPLVRAWSRACDVPPNVQPEKVSVKDTLQAINSFRNRFAHVPFPYDQLQEICREFESCTFRIFEIKPTAKNDESPLSGSFAIKESLLRGAGYRNTPETWQAVHHEAFVWGGKNSGMEVWNGRPFILLDKMMRPYLLSRLKNDAGSWEYIRYLAEANAVYGLNDPDLLKLLPRPSEADYRIKKEEEVLTTAVAQGGEGAQFSAGTPVTTREQAIAAVRDRDFEPAIQFFKQEVEKKPHYHSGWQRLGFAQREYGVDLIETDRDTAEKLLRESVGSFTHAASHNDPQYEAEAYYNRSKSHWRLWRLTGERQEYESAVQDAQRAATAFYDHKFVSWREFLKENVPGS